MTAAIKKRLIHPRFLLMRGSVQVARGDDQGEIYREARRRSSANGQLYTIYLKLQDVQPTPADLERLQIRKDGVRAKKQPNKGEKSGT